MYDKRNIEQEPSTLISDLLLLTNNFQLSDIIFAIPVPKNQTIVLEAPHPDLKLNPNEHAYALNLHTTHPVLSNKTKVLSHGAVSRLLSIKNQLRLDIQGDGMSHNEYFNPICYPTLPNI